MTFRNGKIRPRPKQPARSSAVRHEETAWTLVDLREQVVDACTAFASKVEVRGGYLSAKDSRSWECLLDAVRHLDLAIDVLAPRLPASSGFQARAGFRTAPPKPPRPNPADRDWS